LVKTLKALISQQFFDFSDIGGGNSAGEVKRDAVLYLTGFVGKTLAERFILRLLVNALFDFLNNFLNYGPRLLHMYGCQETGCVVEY
jgi:hypothetical protein